ncbi:MAG: WD40 repeat domain-containing protein, partial [Anaerolineales bacterium]
KGHTDYVSSVAWSADGRLASGSVDNTVKIARADVLKMNICNWNHRNLTEDEWLTYQGVFYIYRPACSNLPSPITIPTVYGVVNDISTRDYANLEVTLLSWKGRGILLGIVVLLIAILTGSLWILRKLILWVAQTIKNRVKKEPGAA